MTSKFALTATRILLAAALAPVALVVSLQYASAGTAVITTGVGWLWANKSHMTGSYTPDKTHSYNSSGESINVKRLSTGSYQIDFAGLYIDDLYPTDVQVSAVSTNGYCMIATWDNEGANGVARMYVGCFDASGNAADAQFNLLYQWEGAPFGSHDKGLAFLWEGNPKAAHHEAESAYSFNSTGGTNSITRNGVGDYIALFPGLTKAGGNVQVSAVALHPTAIRCKAAGWSTNSTGTRVHVLCFGSGGPVNSWFSASYSIGTPVVHSGLGAYAFADKTNSTSTYQPAPQYNGYSSAEVMAEKAGAGKYDVMIPGANGLSTSTVLATSVGNNSGYCNISSANPIEITCYKQGGTPMGSKFSLTFKSSK